MSRLLPERTLAVHRKVSEDNLPDLADVYKPSKAKASGGMVTRSFGPKVGVLPCRMIPVADMNETLRADGLALDARWGIVVPLNGDVKVGYRLVVKGKNYQHTVDIVGTANPRTDATVRHIFGNEVDE